MDAGVVSSRPEGTFHYYGGDHYRGPVSVLGFSDPNPDADGYKVGIRYLKYLANHPETGSARAQVLRQSLYGMGENERDFLGATLLPHLFPDAGDERLCPQLLPFKGEMDEINRGVDDIITVGEFYEKAAGGQIIFT